MDCVCDCCFFVLFVCVCVCVCVRARAATLAALVLSLEDFLSPLAEGWMLLCKELIMAKDSPHIAMQCRAF